jgi:ABC-2 type transport system permease protein
MGRLIKSEFRKTLTTRLWWTLLIPAIALAFGFAFVWGRITNNFVEYLGRNDLEELTSLLGIDADKLPVGMLGLAHGINVATIFAMIFGVLALAGEYHRKTITTTFLTAPTRFHALTAKMATYVLWGVGYGAVIFLAAGLGVAIGVDGDRLPSTEQWLGMLGAGILATVLVTLFGIGFGAVLNSVIASNIILIVYMLIIENVLVLFLWFQAPWLGAILPNGTANGIVGGVGAEAFGAAASTSPLGLDEELRFALQFAAGAPGVQSWWESALVFSGWALLFFVVGWAINQRRDIT